jgi:hypothetical protein
MQIILPKTPTIPTSLNPRILVLYGPPKCGKTTIVSKLPGHLLVDTEEGSDYVEAVKLKPKTIAEYREICNEVLRQGKPYKYGVLDTIDQLEVWSENEATIAYKSSPVGKSFTGDSVLELPMGAGYLWLRNTFMDHLKKFIIAFEKVIFISHVRDSQLAGKTSSGQPTQGMLGANGEVMAKSLDLTGKIRNMVCARADAIGYMIREASGKLTITFKTHELVNCGSRCPHLAGQNIEFTSWDQIYKPIVG